MDAGRRGARRGAELPRTPRAVLKRGTARFAWARRGRGSVCFATGLSKYLLGTRRPGAALVGLALCTGAPNCDSARVEQREQTSQLPPNRCDSLRATVTARGQRITCILASRAKQDSIAAEREPIAQEAGG